MHRPHFKIYPTIDKSNPVFTSIIFKLVSKVPALSFLFMIVLLIIIAPTSKVTPAAVAQTYDQNKLTVTTDTSYYTGRFPVKITGVVSKDIIQEGKSVKITVYDPSDTVYRVAEAAVSPVDGSYSYIMSMDEYDLPAGDYTVVSDYLGYTAETKFYFSEDKNRPRTYTLTVDGKEDSKVYSIEYVVYNGRLQSISANPESGTIDIYITSTDSGELDLTLPNQLIREVAGYNGFSGYFLDGEFFSEPEKELSACDSQQLQIDFEMGTKTITLGQDPEWRP